MVFLFFFLKKNPFIEEKQSRKETKKGSRPDADPPRELRGILNRRAVLDNSTSLGQAALAHARTGAPLTGWVRGADLSLETRGSQDGFAAAALGPVPGLSPTLPAQVVPLRNPCLQLFPVQLFPKMPSAFLPPERSVPVAHPIPFTTMLLNTVCCCLRSPAF